MTLTPASTPLLADIRLLIDGARQRVADYLTLLPPRETLQAKLHLSNELARQKLLNDSKNSNEISLSPRPACVNSYKKSSFQPT